MNIALPFVGEISPDLLYPAIGAIILTFIIAIVWRSLSKAAVVAILAFIGIVIYAMTR